jgi:UDP-N-acetylglucosamine 2-epimerase (non-hydrolysing)
MDKIRFLVIFGTRPEAIKLAPVILKAKADASFDIKVCVTGQHREMLDQVLTFFGVQPDFDLNIMKPNQNLFDVTTEALKGIKEVISENKPDWLFVQGDTTTTFSGAVAAFYEKVRIAHVEAGLRSFNKYSPFPEEMNRVLTTHLSDIHLAPTPLARENLLKEGVSEEKVFVVGNTCIDALFLCLKKIEGKGHGHFAFLRSINLEKRIILVTGHRRESFGEPFEHICHALKTIARYNNVEIVYPVHLNPNVRKPVYDILRDMPNVHLIGPLDYPSFVWLMNKSHIILTDSGGVQEEAPSLGKPVLVMRDITERVEGVKAGTAILVGTNKDMIVDKTTKLLNDRTEYSRMSRARNPYGDGNSSERILDIIKSYHLKVVRDTKPKSRGT